MTMGIWEQALGPTLKLTRDELLLLDWAMSAAGRFLPEMDTETLMKWRDCRTDVWLGLRQLPPLHPLPVEGDARTVIFTMDEGNGHLLMAYLPVTFRWGSGPDCGYSLKSKIALLLWPAGENYASQNQTNNQAGTQGQPAGET